MILLKGLPKDGLNYAFNYKILVVFAGILFSFLNLNAQLIDVEVPKIRYVSINPVTGNIEIKWEKSTTPGVHHYTINYERLTEPNPKPSWVEVPGIMVLATDEPFVSFSPSLLDRVDITQKPVAFAVEAHIDALNSSQVDLLSWDSTMLLKGTYDTCLAEIPLSWNPYDFNMWDFFVFVYRIYVSQNGAPYVVNTTVTRFVNSYTLRNLAPNNNYSIYIAAIPAFPGLRSDSATSNRIDINTFMALQPDSIVADYATISGNHIEMQFTIDPKAQLDEYKILRATDPAGPFDSIKTLKPDNNVIKYTDPVNFMDGPFYYQLEAVNYCNIVVLSSENLASSVLLKNTGETLSPVLQWNRYVYWHFGDEIYHLERRFGDEDFQLISTQRQLAYSDNEIASLAERGYHHSVCYRLTAVETDNPTGNNYSSVSNTVCIELPLNIRFEYDAFIPGDPMNGRFGPTIDFIPDEFKMEIVDRSGRVVYQSEDPTNCNWDGSYNGQYVSGGAYMYVLWYRLGSGKKQFLRGGLAVVYP